MLEKDIFKKTEGRLYRYFKTLQQIKCFNLECEELEKQKDRIRKDIRETNVFIEEESRAITYEERVQTSSKKFSYAENEIIKGIENLEKEWIYVRRKLLKRKAKIRELERQIVPLKYNISMLSEESKKFIEWKYSQCKSVEWIANQMYGGARATAYRKREELVKSLIIWNNFYL
ncbi:hypothetical protein RSJ22_12805 [Clostridium botulinum]|uniref:transcriptional regulator n=1 Tax=Clostridium botulinum TaxID=1491 RepID=UPI000C774157|nr:transcriptional regulator [Clostridium botulinum]AUN22267.1 hypothetical protein RSJ22_12805 [Clostridium botulinum]